MKKMMLGAFVGLGTYKLYKTRVVQKVTYSQGKKFIAFFSTELVKKMRSNGMTDEEMTIITKNLQEVLDIYKRRMPSKEQ